MDYRIPKCVMGIRGLHTFLTSEVRHGNLKCFRTVSLGSRTVFVDGDGFVQWICLHLYGHVPFKQLESVKEQMRSTSVSKDVLRQLMRHNTLIFVFDSKFTPRLKVEKKEKRKKDREIGRGIVEQFAQFHSEGPLSCSLPKRQYDAFKNTDIVTYLNKEMKDRLKKDLRDLGVHIHEVESEEADVTIARLHGNTKNSCILANDTDFIVYPCVTEYYLLDTLDLDSLRVTLCDVCSIVQYFKRRWNFHIHEWILAMQCCGSDYVPRETIRSLRAHFTRKPKYMSWIEHTMNQQNLFEIIQDERFSRIQEAARIYACCSSC